MCTHVMTNCQHLSRGSAPSRLGQNRETNVDNGLAVVIPDIIKPET